MYATKVEFFINTQGPVTQSEIAEALFKLFQNGPFAYPKPTLINTTQDFGSERHRTIMSSQVNGEVISI